MWPRPRAWLSGIERISTKSCHDTASSRRITWSIKRLFAFAGEYTRRLPSPTWGEGPGRPAQGRGLQASDPYGTPYRPITPALSPTLSNAMQASVLLTNPFHRQGDLYFFGSRPQVHGDTEVRQFELGASLKTLTVTTPGIFTTAQALGVDYHILGHSAQGQLAVDLGFVVAQVFHRSAFKGSLRILAHVQEVLGAQVLVPLRMVGIHAGSVDHHGNLGLFRLFLIESEAAAEVVEATIQPAIAQMADLELDKGMGILGVDFIFCGISRTHADNHTQYCC